MWGNQYVNDIGNDCLASVDGTDFQLAWGANSFVTNSKRNLVYDMKLLCACAQVILFGQVVRTFRDYTTILKYSVWD